MSNSSLDFFRPNPFVADAGTRITLTLEGPLAGWLAQLKRPDSAQDPCVWNFMSSLAVGRITQANVTQAQDAFNQLIERGEWDVFVAVFERYSEIRTEAASKGGLPFQPELVLQRPELLRTADEAAMKAAFEKISVSRVVVMRTPLEGRLAQSLGHRADEASSSDDDCSFDTSSDDEHPRSCKPPLLDGFAPAPRALSVGLAALLKGKGDIRELVLPGALEDAALVADALADSPLEAIELGSTPTAGKRLTEPEKASHKTVLAGLAKCKRLEHLTLAHCELANLHETLRTLAAPGGPSLKSLRLVGEAFALSASAPNHRPDVKFTAFMEAVKMFTALSRFDLNVTLTSVNSLSTLVLFPLGDHRHLETLTLVGDSPVNAEGNMGALFALASFWLTHPSLHDFTWKAGAGKPDGGLSLQQYAKMGGDIFQAKDGKSLTLKLKASPLAQRSVKMIGVPLAVYPFNALLEHLGVNAALEEMDVSGCCVPVQALNTATASLANNTTLRRLGFPQHTHGYYFAPNANWVCGFEPVNEPGPQDFHIDSANLLPTPRNAAAIAGFDPIRPSLNTTGPQAMLDSRHREALMAQAYPALQVDVERLLAAAVQGNSSAPQQIPVDVAKVVLDHLGEERELRRVVRLSEISKSVDHRSRRNDAFAQPVPPEVKALVQADNRYAVRNKMPSRPLDVNRVNAAGGNVQLIDAAVKGDVKRILELRRKDAVDFKGLAVQATKSAAVVHALTTPLIKDVVTTTSTTATTTTTTSAVTTSTQLPEA